MALGSEMPQLPSCQVTEAAMPSTPIHAATLRVTIPFCFCRHSWRHCQSKPANIISGMLCDFDLQKSFISSYGWRTLQSAQWSGYAEAVTGFLKIDNASLASSLKLSGKHGVFIEHLASNRPNMAQRCHPLEPSRKI